jgi:predicted ABC-type ATPase
MNNQQRIRMFAGPNGSGKSTMLEYFEKELNKKLLGIYINADDIEKNIKQLGGRFSFIKYQLLITENEIKKYFYESELLIKENLIKEIEKLRISDGMILFDKELIESKTASYFASIIVYIIRHELLKQEKSFTFETVMSSVDKIEFFEEAQKKDIKTYLYYIATEDPIINISRIKYRVGNGGHNVPEDKIISRYHRSLELLKRAIRASHRVYIYDNSGDEPEMIAEIYKKQLTYKVKEVPFWFMNAMELI